MLLTLSPVGWAAISVLLFFVFKWLRDRSRFNRLIGRIPGPKPLPFLGNALDIKAGYEGTLETMQITWPEKYGEIHCWFAGPQCNISLSSPELMEPLLTSQKILDKGTDYKWYRPWLIDGLLISSGQKWRARRRLITPAFHFKILDDFVDVFNKQSRTLCEVLKDRCRSDDGEGRVIDIYPLLTSCALDIIMEAAMGTPVNAQLTGEGRDYARNVHRMAQIISERTTKPWLANDLIFPLTPTGREHNGLLSKLHSFTEDTIRRRRQMRSEAPDTDSKIDEDLDSKKKSKKSLLDLLLDSSDGQGLTDGDIREEIDTFCFGGHDTTSAASTWFIYNMALHPEHQEKVYDELRDVFGDSARECTIEDMANLKYLDCCVKEVLRLFPSAPLIERMATEDVQIGDYTIPAGCNILMLIYGMHRNPRLFPDPTVFDPERFFPEQCIGRNPFAYIPFSAGPRNCIGQKFALYEQKVVVTSLLRKFKFSISPTAQPVIPSYQIVLKPLMGLHLLVTPR